MIWYLKECNKKIQTRWYLLHIFPRAPLTWNKTEHQKRNNSLTQFYVPSSHSVLIVLFYCTNCNLQKPLKRIIDLAHFEAYLRSKNLNYGGTEICCIFQTHHNSNFPLLKYYIFFCVTEQVLRRCVEERLRKKLCDEMFCFS